MGQMTPSEAKSRARLFAERNKLSRVAEARMEEAVDDTSSMLQQKSLMKVVYPRQGIAFRSKPKFEERTNFVAQPGVIVEGFRHTNWFQVTAIVKRGPDEEATGILAEDGEEQELLSAAPSPGDLGKSTPQHRADERRPLPPADVLNTSSLFLPLHASADGASGKEVLEEIPAFAASRLLGGAALLGGREVESTSLPPRRAAEEDFFESGGGDQDHPRAQEAHQHPRTLSQDVVIEEFLSSTAIPGTGLPAAQEQQGPSPGKLHPPSSASTAGVSRQLRPRKLSLDSSHREGRHQEAVPSGNCAGGGGGQQEPVVVVRPAQQHRVRRMSFAHYFQKNARAFENLDVNLDELEVLAGDHLPLPEKDSPDEVVVQSVVVGGTSTSTRDDSCSGGVDHRVLTPTLQQNPGEQGDAEMDGGGGSFVEQDVENAEGACFLPVEQVPLNDEVDSFPVDEYYDGGGADAESVPQPVSVVSAEMQPTNPHRRRLDFFVDAKKKAPQRDKELPPEKPSPPDVAAPRGSSGAKDTVKLRHKKVLTTVSGPAISSPEDAAPPSLPPKRVSEPGFSLLRQPRVTSAKLKKPVGRVLVGPVPSSADVVIETVHTEEIRGADMIGTAKKKSVVAVQQQHHDGILDEGESWPEDDTGAWEDYHLHYQGEVDDEWTRDQHHHTSYQQDEWSSSSSAGVPGGTSATAAESWVEHYDQREYYTAAEWAAWEQQQRQIHRSRTASGSSVLQKKYSDGGGDLLEFQLDTGMPPVRKLSLKPPVGEQHHGSLSHGQHGHGGSSSTSGSSGSYHYVVPSSSGGSSSASSSYSGGGYGAGSSSRGPDCHGTATPTPTSSVVAVSSPVTQGAEEQTSAENSALAREWVSNAERGGKAGRLRLGPGSTTSLTRGGPAANHFAAAATTLPPSSVSLSHQSHQQVVAGPGTSVPALTLLKKRLKRAKHASLLSEAGGVEPRS